MEEAATTFYYYGQKFSAPQTTRTIIFHPTVTSIAANAFESCNLVMLVNIPDLVTSIDSNAFNGCKSITSLSLSLFLKSIGDYSFCGCSSVQSLLLPPYLRTIGKVAFAGCSSLQSIHLQDEQTFLSVKTIDKLAFAYCTSLASIPNFPALQIIGTRAFGGCRFLTEVTLGPSITSAARDSFRMCASLNILRGTYQAGVILPWAITHVILDPSTTKISSSAFAGCDRLRHIVLSRKVIIIGSSSFYGCRSLSDDFTLPDSIVKVGIGAFARCSHYPSNLPFHATQDIYTYMGGEGEMAPKQIKEVIIDETVQEIKERDFEGTAVERITIQASAIHIQPHAFSCCANLREITFTNESTTEVIMESKAFKGCQRLSILNMPKAMKWVMTGEYGSRVLPKDRTSLPSIHENTFEGCPAHIIAKYNRYRVLQRSWNWLIQKERECNILYDSLDCGTNMPLLDSKDLDILREMCSLRPPASNDIVDAVLKYLNLHDYVLCGFPCEVIYIVLQYF
eukprot:CAMPEP_0194366698 /NCGR_PEP_ID=MMETSP0174-20130528/14756_1 /TAXON_ID=216777 /ORGANISM="Proboscia alata, Strain PI-D3" /LENGTH=508 /DNA_ID=CAMNT_0039142037 /DNA_START=47 /DNA_END=1573 /DNA_ORIENTATION=-